MQKVKLIALLALVCFCVATISAYGQIPTTNWPKFGRDYYNSGRSPATVIAKPIVKWSSQCKDFGTAEDEWGSASFDGVKIDPDGNVYAFSNNIFCMAKFDSNGNLLYNDSGVFNGNTAGFYHGPTLYNDGTNQLIIAGPQGGSDAYTATSTSDEYDRTIYTYDSNYDYRWVEMLDWNLSYVRQTPLFNMANISSFLPNPLVMVPDTALPGWNTHTSPAVGPDGSAYSGCMITSYYDQTGPVVKFDPLTGNIVWSFIGEDGQVGRCLGTFPIKTIEDGGATKNVLYVAGGTYWESDVTYGYPSIFALQDDGASATQLWARTIQSTDNDPTWGSSCGFFTSAPVLSADGNTVYVAGRDNWPQRRQNTMQGWPSHITGTLFAYNASDGALKWKIMTGGSHAFSPSLGADGTIYVTGGHIRNGYNSIPDTPPISTAGKVIAVQDNGTSASIKWSLGLPDDECSDTTTLAVTSTTPTTMYVATGNARVYCIQDTGTYGKILWTWQAYDLKYNAFGSVGYAPSNIAIADDGTICFGLGNRVYAFDASAGGFNPASPEGISGTVKDAAGDPVVGAWVCASTSPSPLADTPKRLWTKTNEDGTYQISPKDAGSYYVAASAEGYGGSADQTADLTSLTNKVTVNFTLQPAKYNWAFCSATSGTNINNKTSYAVDGTYTTIYQAKTSAADATIVIDIGAEESINEVVLHTNWTVAKTFSIAYSNDSSTWNTVYSTTAGMAGFPVEWSAYNPYTAGYPWEGAAYASTKVGAGGGIRNMNTIKFPAVSARYWKVTSGYNSGGYAEIGAFTNANGTTSIPGFRQIELRDSTKEANVPATIEAAKAAPDNTGCYIQNVQVTASPGGGIDTATYFIENADRTSGIRFNRSSSFAIGDMGSVKGKIYTDANGERYVDGTFYAAVVSRDNPALEEVGMNNKAIFDEVAQGIFVKTWGKVSGSTTGSFYITDGTTTPLKVLCDSTSSMTLPADDDYIRVRGLVSKDSSGVVLRMRNERADWAYDTDTMHALPFEGRFDYPTQYLVLGPFTDPGVTNAYDLLDEDFIGEANIGTTIKPVEGLVTAGKTWTKGLINNGTGVFDVAAALGGGSYPASVAYVYLYVWSEVDSPSVAVLTGSDDWLNIYVNGSLAGSIDETLYPTGRTCTVGEDFTVITLNQGLNAVLFKVVNNTTDTFSLSDQFVDSGAYGTTGYGKYTPYSTTGLGYSLAPASP